MRSVSLSVFIAATVAGLPAVAAAQEPPRWSVGALGMAYRSPYAVENTSADGDEKLDLMAFPYIAYRGDLFFIEGQEAGLHLLNREIAEGTSVSFDAVASFRTPASIYRDKISGDIGGTFSLDGAFGSLSVSALTDFTDVHNGLEISASYGYTFSSAKVSVTPSIGVVWQSRKLADHTWGTSQAQSDRLLANRSLVQPAYAITESVLNYEAGLVVTYNFNRRWTLLGIGGATLLDKTIKAHPGINEDFDARLGLGLAYSF